VDVRARNAAPGPSPELVGCWRVGGRGRHVGRRHLRRGGVEVLLPARFAGHGGLLRLIVGWYIRPAGFGAVATHYGFGVLGASGIGFLSGASFAGLIYAFASFLYGQQASTDIHPRDVVGQAARVIVPIPKDGVGQVRCQIGEQLLDKIARTRDGVAIAENAAVTVVDVLGETVIVEPANLV
jgi:membrane protein implicated in regulation of membrane protease activity